MVAEAEIVRMKKIVGYEDYAISENGDVFSYRTNKFLKPQKNRRGYYCVLLYRDGNVKLCRIHRLVAEAFLPNPNGYDTVDHIDGCKENNCVSNLQWMTAADNTRKANNKPVAQYTRYGEFVKQYNSVLHASAETGVDRYDIAACARGKCNSRGYIRKTAGNFVWRYI